MNWEKIHMNFLHLLASFILENKKSMKDTPIIEIYKFSVSKMEKYLANK